MIELNVREEENKTVDKTMKKFLREKIKVASSDDFPLGFERRKQYDILKKCLLNEDNKKFIVENIVNDGHDNFTKIAEAWFADYAFSEPLFIFLLSGQSLTNRIVKACKEKKVYVELVYRLRQCIWIYSIIQAS